MWRLRTVLLTSNRWNPMRSKLLLWSTAVALPLALSACAPHTDYFETRAFEVTVDLTAEGRRMQITRTIECEPRRRRHAGIRPYTQWRAATKSFGERLPSGAAVMMVTPSFCRSAYRKPGMKGDELPVSPGHVPYIGWADNAEDPSVVETYISPDYFKRPDARVRYHGMTARLVPGDEMQTKRDEIGWFMNWKTLSGDETAYALYAQAIPHHIWKKIPVVASYVRNLESPTLLPRNLTFVYGKEFNLLYGTSRLRKGYGLSAGPSPDRAYDRETAPSGSSILPLRQIKGRYSVNGTEKGYLAFYRVVHVPLQLPSVKLRIGDTDVEIPVRSSGIYAVYVPQTSTIYRILSGVVTRFPKKPQG